MAKKEKAPEAEGEKPEGEGAEGAPKKKGLKKILIIAVPALLLVLGGGGAGAYFFLFKKEPAKEAKAAEEVPLTPPTVAYSELNDLLVNIQGDGSTPSYLKLSVSLELENEEQKKAVETLLPRVKDQFQAYMREIRLDDLKGSAGVQRLKEELLRRVNVAAAPYHVRDVLLKDMLVQ